MDTVQNAHLDAIKHNNEIIFLYTVKPGATNRSYGIQVAQLAGIPRAVINQANHQLDIMEKTALTCFRTSRSRTCSSNPMSCGNY